MAKERIVSGKITLSQGEGQGVLSGGSPHLPLGMERVQVTDFPIGTDPKFLTVNNAFLGEAGTAIRSGIKPLFGDLA